MDGVELQRVVGQILGELVGIRATLDQINQRLTAHSDRIRSLENRWAWATGAAAVLGGGIGYALALWRP